MSHRELDDQGQTRLDTPALCCRSPEFGKTEHRSLIAQRWAIRHAFPRRGVTTPERVLPLEDNKIYEEWRQSRKKWCNIKCPFFLRMGIFRSKTSLIATLAFICGSSLPVYADTFWETAIKNERIILKSFNKEMGPVEETINIVNNWKEYRRQKKEEDNRYSIAQLLINGSFPTLSYTSADIGRSYLLQYNFIEPSTGNPASIPPDYYSFSSVRYYVTTKPFAISESDISESFIRSNFSLVGEAFNPFNDYSISFTLDSLMFEPQLYAFAVDAAGNELSIEGSSTFASYIAHEVPGPLPILGVGVFGASARKLRALSRLKTLAHRNHSNI